MTPLYAELNRWLAVPHRWGESDCVMLCADWVQRIRGIDPAEDLRLTYGTAGECQQVTRFFTDPIGCIGPRMEAAGLPRTSAPVAGDVGILLMPVSGASARPYGALCLGRTWAAKMIEGGIHAGPPLKLLAAWSVGYAHP